MTSRKKQIMQARRAAVQELSDCERVRSFVHASLVSSTASRFPSDVRALARAIETCPNRTGRERACSCAVCEGRRALLARHMPAGTLTRRDGVSEARALRKDLDEAI